MSIQTRHKLRLLGLAAAIGAAFVAVIAFGAPSSPGEVRETVQGLGPLAPLVLVGAWIILTPILFSSNLLAAAGGLAFGAWLGTAVAIVGALAGGLVAFLIARRIGQAAAQQLCGERLERLQARLVRRGFVTVLAARLAPAIPGTWLHYACGLSRVRVRDFLAGIAIGGAPKLFAFASLGSSGGDLSSAPALIGLGLIGALTLLGVVISLRGRSSGPAPA
jgi:uncharacterized membrane protein YdjX (TVP38/TMEM64 family)